MSKKALVLAEKNSAARNFAKALGSMEGTFEGQRYVIYPLRGHVLELKDPEDQVSDEKRDFYKSWTLENLPWNEKDIAFKKCVIKGCNDVLKGLKEALKDVNEVIIATDDDPSGEGELLAWEALDWVDWHNYTTRMYFADESAKQVKKAFRERKVIESMFKDGDYLKAMSRSRFDWMSMQFARISTLVARQRGYRMVVRQGRLKSVMVKLVGDQQKAYEEYVKKPFFEVRFKDRNGNIFKRDVADDMPWRFERQEDVDVSKFDSSDIEIDSDTQKSRAPGKLLDLAAITAILSQKGYKGDEVLKTYQDMYEHQILSYPRTEDKKITTEQFNELLPKVDDIADVVGVNSDLLTHREIRKTHVGEGMAHGANRPGPSVPKSLDSLSKYGRCAKDLYVLVAKNFLAMFGENYKYRAVKAHLVKYPEFKSTTSIPLSLGFKAVFDADSESKDDNKKENSKEFEPDGEPFVFEGANKRPPRPTMKWLSKRLEKENVGTGATRASTLSDVCKGGDKRLLNEKKGILSLSECGQVSYILLDECDIASVGVTAQLFDAMERVGDFKESPENIVASIRGMVLHDLEQMKNNSKKLKRVSSDNLIEKCPLCGEAVAVKNKILMCSTARFKQDPDTKKWKQTEGCEFKCFKSFMGKVLTEKQLKDLLAGKRVKVSGLKSKKGKTYSAFAKLSSKANKQGFYTAEMDGFE